MPTDIDTLLQSVFGFNTFREGQREVIEELLGDGRSLAVFPTGGGKSLCYQLPALALEGTTIVVSPLIALMKDQIDFLHARDVRAERLDSSLDKEETFAVQDALRRGELKLLYVAPERFNNERFLETLRQTKIALFAVDEAHCISEWGHNFRPDYLKLADTARDLDIKRILALTATATPEVATAICEGFDIPPAASINTGFYRPNLNLCLTPVEANKRKVLLLHRLQHRKPGTTIVYVTLQKTAEQIADFLCANDLPAKAYHAGMKDDERPAVQDWWMNGDSNIVVATIAFGMGIDKSAVRYVYHFNLPKGLESYSQEIGRAGRDGLPSTVELFACPEDVPTLENFVYGDTPTDAALRGLVQELLGQKSDISISEYELSRNHDLRPLVLRTCLTYLELEGVLRQGTPFYTTYEVQPHSSLENLYASFGTKAQSFLRQLFATARKGKTWWKIDVQDAIASLHCDRKHIVHAVGLIEDRQLGKVKVSGARKRFQRLTDDVEIENLVHSLSERFAKREQGDIGRIADMLKLVEHEGCQTNAMVAYFGEQREQPCGHCTFCKTGKAAVLPASKILPAMESVISIQEVTALRNTHPAALGQPRQIAKLLCGLSSPALSKARLLYKYPFGTLENYHFKDVLTWSEKYF